MIVASLICILISASAMLVREYALRQHAERLLNAVIDDSVLEGRGVPRAIIHDALTTKHDYGALPELHAETDFKPFR